MDIGPMKLDAVGPRRDLDSYVGFRRRLPVVLRQSLADLGGPHPDDGIFRSVVIGDTSKHLDADDPLLQQFILTFVAVFHHRAEKFSTLVALAEGRARQHSIECGADFRLLSGGMARRARCGLGRIFNGSTCLRTVFYGAYPVLSITQFGSAPFGRISGGGESGLERELW